ncbi:DUF2243 domain-containing protein (plasmid) [Sphingomonas carotinifaciens]|uniref:DUF2243 domain-containing protein n=1 Tax=Sphingomonas carotinifaciens TaxID=1166323 RepID=UPI0039A0B03D
MGKDPVVRWGGVLGFALGGFFDGIVLHQILQWHHLLSLVPGVDSLRMQVLWDGYFHALMYLVALAGLVGLWRHRAAAGSTHWLGAVPVGFGAWHVLDSVLSHWVLGIHRIRVDSAAPLMWDVIWFAAFGVVPLLLGWMMLRRGRVVPAGGAAAAMVAVVTLGAAFWSARPAEGARFTTLVFAPGVTPAAAMDAVLAEEARLVWSDRAMGVMVVDVAPERRATFYRRGALLVSGAGLSAGCFNWSAA